jgi:hypothetical protein
MKVLRNTVIAFLIIGMASMTSSCLGGFNLTKKLYTWNDSVSSNKFVNNLIFWAFVIIPVYGVTLILDGIIFNVIEFWGGSNPISMEEGDYEVEYHNYAGVGYKIEATPNTFTITQLDGAEEGKITVVRFDPDTQTWFYEVGDDSIALMSFEGEESNTLNLYTAAGEPVEYDLTEDYTPQEIRSKYIAASEYSTTASK